MDRNFIRSQSLCLNISANVAVFTTYNYRMFLLANMLVDDLTYFSYTLVSLLSVVFC